MAHALIPADDDDDVTVAPAPDPHRAARVAGWYGKLPGIGDFAMRRLPPQFVALWDQWLQRCVETSRGTLGAAWLDTYLPSPIWRFALTPGVCGPHAWTGVLMPSVDRVGRYFPLTLAVRVEPPMPFSRIVAQEQWFDAIERVALGCLAVSVRPDDVETALHACPLPPLGGTAAVHAAEAARALDRADASLLRVPAGEPIDRLIMDAENAALESALSGRTLWWTHAGDAQPSVVAAMLGLPEPARYAAMLQVRAG